MMKWYDFETVKPPTGLVVLFEDFDSHLAAGVFDGLNGNSSNHIKASVAGDSFNCASPCKRWAFIDEERFYYRDYRSGNYVKDPGNTTYEIKPIESHPMLREEILQEMRIIRGRGI